MTGTYFGSNLCAPLALSLKLAHARDFQNFNVGKHSDAYVDHAWIGFGKWNSVTQFFFLKNLCVPPSRSPSNLLRYVTGETSCMRRLSLRGSARGAHNFTTQQWSKKWHIRICCLGVNVYDHIRYDGISCSFVFIFIYYTIYVFITYNGNINSCIINNFLYTIIFCINFTIILEL